MKTAVPPLGALSVIGVALAALRQAPGLFFGLALLGFAPLVAGVLWLARLDATGGLAPGGRAGPNVFAAAALVSLGFVARAYAHAAILWALERKLACEPVDVLSALRGARPHAPRAIFAGVVIALVGCVSGFLAFVPVVLFGGAVALVVPRIVYQRARVADALKAGGNTKTIAVGLLVSAGGALFLLNVYLALHLVLALARTFFDVDTAFSAAVLSLGNKTFAITLVMLTLALLEAPRVLGAGLLYFEANARAGGLDIEPRLESLRRPRVSRAFAERTRSRTPASGATTRRPATPLLVALALTSVAAVWGVARPAVARDDEAQRTHLAEVLRQVTAKPEYAHADPSAWDRVDEPVAPREPRLPPLPMPAGNDGIGGLGVFAIVLAVAAVAFAVGLGVVGWRRRRPRGKSKDDRPALQSDDEPAPFDRAGLSALDRAAEDWRARADALAAAGRFREALRHVYLALLAALHGARAIHYDPSRTNGEYVRLLDANERDRRTFRGITRAFDAGWYGGANVDAAAYAAVASQSDALLLALASTTAPPAASPGS